MTLTVFKQKQRRSRFFFLNSSLHFIKAPDAFAVLYPSMIMTANALKDQSWLPGDVVAALPGHTGHLIKLDFSEVFVVTFGSYSTPL